MAYGRSAAAAAAAGRWCAWPAAVDGSSGDGEVGGGREAIVGGEVGMTALGMTIGMWKVLAKDSIVAIDS